MDEMMKMVAGLVVRHGMTALAGVLVSGGLLTKGAETSWTETTVGIVLGILGLFWSWWQKSGQQAVLAKFAKLHGAVPQSSTNAEAAKLATDAVKVASVVLLAVMLAAALATPARAQGPIARKVIGDITGKPMAAPGGAGGLQDILGALDAKLLPDLQYALALATKSSSKVTAPCYQAWITIIETRQSAAIDSAGNALPEPDPHIVTTFEKMVELRNALQPDSDFMIKCSPVASMVKKDIVGFIGVVLSGGAGLATLVPGL